jgi:hypothetical protein
VVTLTTTTLGQEMHSKKSCNIVYMRDQIRFLYQRAGRAPIGPIERLIYVFELALSGLASNTITGQFTLSSRLACAQAFQDWVGRKGFRGCVMEWTGNDFTQLTSGCRQPLLRVHQPTPW